MLDTIMHTHTHTINVNKACALQQTTGKTGTKNSLCEIDVTASKDCHFLIALWYFLTFSYRRLTFFSNCIWTTTFSAKHNNLASVV
jgi:hypothetical protein